MQIANYIENHIVRFIQVLRHLGVRVSSAETVEAIRSLEHIPLLEKQQVKFALRAVLAKDREAQRVFEQAFESYFVPLEQKQERLEQRQQQIQEYLEGLNQAEEELVFAFTDDEDLITDEGQETAMKLDLTEEQKATYAKLQQRERKKLKDYLKAHHEGNDFNTPHNLLESVVRGQLEYWRRKLAQQEQEQEEKRKPPLEVELTGDDDFDEVLEHVAANLDDEETILHEDMQQIADKDIPKVTLLIRKLSRRLATRISRRYRQSQKKQRVDLRRSVRHNIRYGGTMLELKYKTKRVEKPNILLICDVSGSMARYASFVIQFIYGLSSVVDRIESFIFAEDLERVTPYFNSSNDFATTMAGIMNESKQWGKGTNLNVALMNFNERHKNLLNPQTIVVIVSDAKTIAAPKAVDSLTRIKGRVREVLWLNTLPKKEWNNVKNIKDFQKNSRMFECYTLAHLDKILRNQISIRG
ncbi:MAG: VWA domain-containing protein [Clostridia bacterium]|nr:VWA domain-containing protein [Clostridia bacterium]